MHDSQQWLLRVGLVLLFPLVLGCNSADAEQPTEVPTVGVTATATPELPPSGQRPVAMDNYLSFNQSWLEGFNTDGPDLENVDEVFWYIYSRLPDEVRVYPTENYYYFKLHIGGKTLAGNFRLPAGRRDNGVLSFAYFEYEEFPPLGTSRFSRAKYFTEADGLRIEKIDDLTYNTVFKGKTVTFNFLRLPQEPPALFTLADDEVFVERTFDESGYEFFLLFNETRDYFLWVLNEENGVSDDLVHLTEELVVGKRSGFAFWIDAAHDDRMVLISIRRLSVSRNDYYDGPFDQLADNYADEVDIQSYIVRAIPGLEGRIDRFGYYTDTERPVRVALSNYGTYSTNGELFSFLETAKTWDDPFYFISRGGVPLPEPQVTATPVAGPEAEATSTPEPSPTPSLQSE